MAWCSHLPVYKFIDSKWNCSDRISVLFAIADVMVIWVTLTAADNLFTVQAILYHECFILAGWILLQIASQAVVTEFIV